MLAHVGPAEVDRIRIEAQKHVGAAHVEIPDLVNLVRHRDRLAEECHQRVGAIRHLDDNGLVPGMLVEIAADELMVFRPLVERVGRRVHAEKTTAPPNEIDEGPLLRAAHGQFTRRAEHHGPLVPQVLGRERCDVLGRSDFETSRRTDLVEDIPGSRNDLMAVPGRMGEVENAARPILSARRPYRKRGGHPGEECNECDVTEPIEHCSRFCCRVPLISTTSTYFNDELLATSAHLSLAPAFGSEQAYTTRSTKRSASVTTNE